MFSSFKYNGVRGITFAKIVAKYKAEPPDLVPVSITPDGFNDSIISW